jgi:hypothetical protein
MSRRTRGGKEDDYRWFMDSGQPNFQGYGRVGDGVAMPPPRPLTNVGGLVVLTADVVVPAVDPMSLWSCELMLFYDAITLQAIRQFFLPIGVCVIGGNSYLGVEPPAGIVNVQFGLNASSPPDTDLSTIWTSTNVTLSTGARFVVSSLNHAQSNAPLTPIPLGVNSLNVSAGGLPFTQMSFSVYNTHATNPCTAGELRVVCWGVEA